MQVDTVKIQNGEVVTMQSENGQEAIDALYSAIIKAVHRSSDLIEYHIHNLRRVKGNVGKLVAQIKYKG